MHHKLDKHHKGKHVEINAWSESVNASASGKFQIPTKRRRRQPRLKECETSVEWFEGTFVKPAGCSMSDCYHVDYIEKKWKENRL